MRQLAFMLVTSIAATPLAVIAVASFRRWENRRRRQDARAEEDLDYQHRRSREALDRHLDRMDGALDDLHRRDDQP